jgi:arylformamidase
MKNESEYNPRVIVSHASEITAQWGVWAAETRAKLAYKTVRYGDHLREIMDIFEGDAQKPTFVFIHGGYFRTFTKDEFSWVANAFVKLGYPVALINYPLCPEVRVHDIAQSCQKAIVLLGENIVVAGHSAGGYLTAATAKTGLAISGVFDLTPLVETSMNEAIRLTYEEAKAWSLTDKSSLICAVGEDETASFHAQSRNKGHYVSLKGHNHFTIIEDLRDETSELFKLALNLLRNKKPA